MTARRCQRKRYARAPPGAASGYAVTAMRADFFRLLELLTAQRPAYHVLTWHCRRKKGDLASRLNLLFLLGFLVGSTGFEPVTPAV